MRSCDPLSWPDALGRVRTWTSAHLDCIHEDADYRRADLLQLEQIAMAYPAARHQCRTGRIITVVATKLVTIANALCKNRQKWPSQAT